MIKSGGEWIARSRSRISSAAPVNEVAALGCRKTRWGNVRCWRGGAADSAPEQAQAKAAAIENEITRGNLPNGVYRRVSEDSTACPDRAFRNRQKSPAPALRCPNLTTRPVILSEHNYSVQEFLL